jgi:hypothetical protein
MQNTTSETCEKRETRKRSSWRQLGTGKNSKDFDIDKLIWSAQCCGSGVLMCAARRQSDVNSKEGEASCVGEGEVTRGGQG